MKIGEAEVRHVAGLAELAIADADVALLAQQLETIVNFVAQLEELPLAESGGEFHVGPDRLKLRADVISPIPLQRTPAEMAPVFRQGFYVVPKLGGMAEE